MPDTAPAQIARIVHLIASMSRRDKREPLTYRAAARHLGVSERVIRQDLNALVRLSDEYKQWLSSLSVVFTADGFALASQGHFRRPFRLTADETLALVVGLEGARGGQQLATKLGRALVQSPVVDRAPTSIGLGPSPSAQVEDVLALAREARDEHRPLELLYCGSNSEPSRRVVDPYQIVQRHLWWYLIAWCEDAGAYRHFRADRVLGATLRDGRFAPRTDFVPIARAEDVFRPEATIPATVAFSPAIARWLTEKYPNGHKQSDGRYAVTFQVARRGSCARCCSTGRRRRCWGRRACGKRCGERSGRSRGRRVFTTGERRVKCASELAARRLPVNGRRSTRFSGRCRAAALAAEVLGPESLREAVRGAIG